MSHFLLKTDFFFFLYLIVNGIILTLQKVEECNHDIKNSFNVCILNVKRGIT